MPIPELFPGADVQATRAYRHALDRFLDGEPHTARLQREVERCPSFIQAHLLLAVLALASGNSDEVDRRLSAVPVSQEAMTRRQRQVTEIVTCGVRGDSYRFQTLAIEHIAEFADDQSLLSACEIAVVRSSHCSPSG